jgi:uncharacterized protein YkwD
VAAATLVGLACMTSVGSAPTIRIAPAASVRANRARTVARCPAANTRPRRTNERTIANAVLCLVNRIRAAHRLPALHANGKLGRVAGTTVLGMLRGDYFADIPPSGRTPMSLAASSGYTPPIAVGQNIGWGTGANATAAHVVAAWMASPGHREVLLDNRYRAAGAADVAGVPAVVGVSTHGATYAIELGAR